MPPEAREINQGGEAFLLAALEKIASARPQLSAAAARILAAQAIAFATTPLDCPGVAGIPFTHLFNGTHCARCGLSKAAYLGEVSPTDGAEPDTAKVRTQ